VSSQPAIQVRDLVKRYGDTVAVDGLSFDVPFGSIFGLLGPDGAGKTSTIRCLAGGQRFEDSAQEVLADFSAAKMWVGHNVSADEKYLRVEMERCGLALPKKATFCTMNYFTSDMNLARKVNIGRPKPPKLTELVQFFDLSEDFVAEKAAEWFGGGGALHDARFDTAATYLCLVEGTKRGRVRGVL
jgi:DNA polymerase-3 subunit epsilon